MEPPIPGFTLPEGCEPLEDDEVAFLRWVSTPEGKAEFKKVLENALAGGDGELPPELQAAAEQSLKAHQQHEAMMRAHELLKEVQEQSEREPEGSNWRHAYDLTEKLKHVANELLELQEPHRSRFLRELIPIQDKLEKIKAAL